MTKPRKVSQATVIGSPSPKTWTELEANCKATFGGGYATNQERRIFRHGMTTIFNLLRAEFPEMAICKEADTSLRAAEEALRARPTMSEREISDEELMLYLSATRGAVVEQGPCYSWTERIIAGFRAARARIAELEGRGFSIGVPCSGCGKHTLQYRGGTICPECNRRGRDDDLSTIQRVREALTKIRQWESGAPPSVAFGYGYCADLLHEALGDDLALQQG